MTKQEAIVNLSTIFNRGSSADTDTIYFDKKKHDDLLDTLLHYIQNSSKPYTSGYFSFSSNYIRNFGICNLDKDEIKFVINEQDKEVLDSFFETKYDIELQK